MSSREIIIELLRAINIDNAEYIANYLVANGTTVQRHGWWITPASYSFSFCSVCGYISDKNTKYCPGCGSDMSTERR